MPAYIELVIVRKVVKYHKEMRIYRIKIILNLQSFSKVMYCIGILWIDPFDFRLSSKLRPLKKPFTYTKFEF